MSKMQVVMLTKKGGLEVLKTVELPLSEPGPGEIRVRILATGVGATDIMMRRGIYPYAPSIPFIPGNDTVDAVGTNVKLPNYFLETYHYCSTYLHNRK